MPYGSVLSNTVGDIRVTEIVGTSATADANPTEVTTVNLTPTWGEWGNFYLSLAECGETSAIKHLRADFRKAMAACQAYQDIQGTLTPEQREIASRTMAAELKKQGVQ